MTRAVVLVSGGMDSLVTAALAQATYQTAFLHVDYGQRTEEKELRCFRSLVRHYQPWRHRVIEMPWLGAIGGSALTDKELDVPHEGIDPTTIPITYVPFRNTLLLSAGVAWAEVMEADLILYGAVERDSSGYPDCRQNYVEAFNRVIATGTARGRIRLEAPLITMSKAEIVLLGARLKVPFELSWSCYGDSHLACGTCDSCRLRREAFQQAGIADPIPYQTDET